MFGSKKTKKTREPNALAKRVVRGDDSPTEPLVDESTTRSSSGVDASEAETRLLLDPDEGAPSQDDPPVAVLVVIAGPGRGELLPVSTGMNALGRGDDQRIALPFGDERISPSRHAVVTYDRVGDQFFIQHGDGPELTYLDGSPVLEPSALGDGAQVRLGETTLLFRILIGPDFQWASGSASAKAP